MLWKECMPRNFYRHTCKEENFLYLNGTNVLQSKVLETIHNFLKESNNNCKDLRNNLSSYKNIFQYIYSNVFPEIYCSTERRGFDLKSNFHIIFKTHKDKKQLEISLGKNPDNYETIRNETSILNRNLSRLMILMKLKRNRSKNRLKNENKNVVKRLKIKNC